MWYLCDPTPSGWCKTDAHSMDFATRRTIDQAAGGKLQAKNAEESWALLEDLALYDNESWNDPRDFAKPVKEISLPQDVPSTSDRRLIELENQVQRLMEAHLAPKPLVQVKKIASSCEICSGPHDTQYCMENPEQAYVEYAPLRNNELGEKRLSSLRTQLKQQQDEVINKINTLWKVVSEKFDNPPVRDVAKDPTPRINVVYHAHHENEAPQNKGIKKGESRDAGVIETNATKDNDRDTVVKVEEGLDGSKPEIKEVKSRDIKRNDLDDRTCGEMNEVEEAGEWTEYEEPLDLVDTCDELVYESLLEKMLSYSLSFDFRIEKGDPSNFKDSMNDRTGHNFVRIGKDMHVFIGNMSHVMDFTILENIEANIDPSLSQVVFGRPFVETTKLILNREQGLITFTNGIKEVTFKTPYKDSEMDDLTSEGHDLLSSRVILSEDDYRRGFKRASDLKKGFYMEVDKLDPSYKEETYRINFDGSFDVDALKEEVSNKGAVT
ncbi:hypothetical protein Tco_0533500 [Tanacetum coccineum]